MKMASHLCDGCKAIIPALQPLPIPLNSKTPKRTQTSINHSFQKGSAENCHLCVLVLSLLTSQEAWDIQRYHQVEDESVRCTIWFTASHDDPLNWSGAIIKMVAGFKAKEETSNTPAEIGIYFELVPWSKSPFELKCSIFSALLTPPRVLRTSSAVSHKRRSANRLDIDVYDHQWLAQRL